MDASAPRGISTPSRIFILTSSRANRHRTSSRGHFDEDLAHGARSTSFRAILKSSARTRIFSRVSAGSAVEVDIREYPPERFHGGFGGRAPRGPHRRTMADVREFGEEPVASSSTPSTRHAARVNLQISLRPLRSGRQSRSRRSKRPGRRSAGRSPRPGSSRRSR